MNPERQEPVDLYLQRLWGSEIKPGREGRVVSDDPAFAGDLQKRLDAEPLAEGVHAPISTALPVGLAPVEYVVHVWTHKCSICQTEHKHSEVYGVNHLRSRTGFGGYVRNMTPVGRLEWNVPLRVIPITTRTTAGCFECIDALREEVLPNLPKPPVPDTILKASAPEGASAPARTDRGPKKPLSTDDFLV